MITAKTVYHSVHYPKLHIAWDGEQFLFIYN